MLLLSLIGVTLAGCHYARMLKWQYADVEDYHRFPKAIVQADTAKPNPFRFAEAAPDTANRIAPKTVTLDGEQVPFSQVLKQTKTIAFLIIRRDTVFYEQYLNGYTARDRVTTFSMAKSLVSAMVGRALQQGHLNSIDEPVTHYLPSLADQGFDSVTIRNLLNMRSGIGFTEKYGNPFSSAARYYYGNKLNQYLQDLEVVRPVGDTFIYQSGNTQLLARVLVKATGCSLPSYLSEALWQPMGMESAAYWSTDQKGGTAKAFCCLNAHARDLARLGRLYLNDGRWKGKTLLDPAWITRSTTPHKRSLNYDYYYHWWHVVNRRPVDSSYRASMAPKPHKVVTRNNKKGEKQRFVLDPKPDFFARGLYGQYLYVAPQHDLMILRFGRETGNFPWETFFRSYARSFQQRP